MSQPSRRHHHRRTLAAACLLLPTPAARATTYDLSYQTVNLATAPYTADDTLNLSSVTFTSSLSNPAPLAASLNLFGTYHATAVNTSANVTLAGPLSGTGAFQKLGSGSLTLTAASPSFTGPVTISSSGPLKLTDPDALGPSSAPTPIIFYGGILDVTGAFPSRPVTFNSITLVNNSTTPVMVGPSLSLSISNSSDMTLSGSGDLTFASPLPHANGTLSKTGTGTITYSTPTSFDNYITVYAGTFRLGIESPFTGSRSSLFVEPGASLDLNGHSSPGMPVYLVSGSLVNNNTSTPSNLSTLPTGNAITLGGTGDINLTAKVASLTKTGTGALTLSAANTKFGGTLTVNDGTLRLNNAAATGTSATKIDINASGAYVGGNYNITAAGTMDLNGFPAPAATYTFNAAAPFIANLVNNNTSTPSYVGADAIFNSSPVFGGDGDIIYTRRVGISDAVYKTGIGRLTLASLDPVPNLAATVYQGTLTLGNPATNAYSGNVTLYGSAPWYPYRPTVIDLNGRSSTPVSVNVYNNGGVVNNNTATPATLDSATYFYFPTTFPQFSDVTLGGDGTLNVTSHPFSDLIIDKIGAGLLTLPASQFCRGFNLRAGTVQVEADYQIVGSYGISFLGGTLRIAPLYLAPKSSYTFSPAISLDPAGGTVDTQRDTTLTGPFSGAGPLTKAGPASLTLANSPSASIDLLVAAGTLRFSPSLPAATIGSLSISPGATLDLRNTALTTSTPYDTLRQYLHDALLTSSSSDPTHTLGCKDTNPGTYYIQLSLTGDANLDGAITPDDYALLDRSYARSTTDAHWSDGDLNYDGTVDAHDYLLIDTTLGQAQGFSPGFLSQRESQFGATYVSQLLTSVPEPSSLLSVCGLALLPLTRRRT